MSNKTHQLQSFGITDIGLIREHNEDAWAAYPEESFFILADGMGGHLAGEIASKESADYLYTLFSQWSPSEDITVESAKKFFRDAFIKVNAWIYDKGEQEAELKGMGTTLCSLFLNKSWAVLAHVGDSRIYRFRESKLEQLTEDHSLVSELISLGAMKSEESETFPYKHILTRAIGTHPKVEPTLTVVQTEPFDLFLLCSDGMSNYAAPEQIEEILQKRIPLARKGQNLVDLALEQGGGDNITLILVQQSSL